ncbi:uncharacterized protein LOC131217301 [Magnolia sinica]|uniref:uncharacterized protein LOC131217301 n=1 Tax=Magnolia sinica TaxID=86752 RepID=UPI00265882C1|nr:uncharacterized protein LOC131217301 [Magnolia sinica]
MAAEQIGTDSLDNSVGPLHTFTITVGRTVLDRWIPPLVKYRYWALCSQHGAILHSGLDLQDGYKAAAAAVGHVVELADKIHSATPDLPISTFDGWINDAEDLDNAGMEVEFLQERIKQLRAFVSGKQRQPLIEQQKARKRHSEITRELGDVEGQIRLLMRKKEELATQKKDVLALLRDLWPRVDACWAAFAELVAAPW